LQKGSKNIPRPTLWQNNFTTESAF